MASYRKVKLNDNSAFLQFNWKADVVESWIGRSKTFFKISLLPMTKRKETIGKWEEAKSEMQHCFSG